MKLLIVEDMHYLRDSLQRGLSHSGYAVDIAPDGEEGLFMAQSMDYDVLILDIMLPKLDGLALLDQYRSAGGKAMVLFLSAKDTPLERAAGLSLGADDYLTKPFAMEELEARIEALCRRRYNLRASHLIFGAMEIYLSKKEVSIDKKRIKLKPREYRILELLVMRKGELVTRTEIESNIYGDEQQVSSNTIESAISSIRKKISITGNDCPIQTRPGFGYMFLDKQENTP